jgi:hypothetical protein
MLVVSQIPWEFRQRLTYLAGTLGEYAGPRCEAKLLPMGPGRLASAGESQAREARD